MKNALKIAQIVPQGNILGPLLFHIYNKFSLKLFANDYLISDSNNFIFSVIYSQLFLYEIKLIFSNFTNELNETVTNVFTVISTLEPKDFLLNDRYEIRLGIINNK